MSKAIKLHDQVNVFSHASAVTTLEPSTEENIWEVKYNNKGVNKVNNENDVIKASSSRGKRKLCKIYLIFAAFGVTDILVYLIVATLKQDSLNNLG